jgi:lipid-A-disaccharide synthase-like uncharacterized protein
MSTETVVKFIIIGFAGLLIVGIRWWARKHPNLSKEHPDRRRMVKVFPIVGWLCVIVGGLMIPFVIFTDDEDAVAMRIACVGILLAGTGFLLMYRNFYVAPREYEVAFRTVLGTERVITYTDIDRYSAMPPFVSVRSTKGIKLNLNTNIYDMTPLLRAIEVRDATGHWPVRPAADPQHVLD